MTKFNKEEAAKFYNLLGFSSCPGYVVISEFENKTSTWVKADDFEGFIQVANDLTGQGHQVYFGCCLKDQELAEQEFAKKNPGKTFSGRGTVDSVTAAPAFWMDLDIGFGQHAQKNLPQTVEEVIDLLNELRFSPSILIHSGGGLHAYWLLDKPFLMADDASRDKFVALMRRAQNYVKAAALQHGWRFDTTSDLARVLRVPGTINTKDPSNSKPVQILFADENLRYTIASLEELFPENETAQPAPQPNQKAVADQELSAEKTADPDLIFERCPFMQHARDDAATLPEPEWYSVLSILGYCKDGETEALAVSAPYPGFSESETLKKLAHAVDSAGPRTCENISEITGAAYCANCEHHGKVKSPISLGYNVSGENLKLCKTKCEEIIATVLAGNKSAHLEKEAVQWFAKLNLADQNLYSQLKISLQDAKAKGIGDFNKLVKTRAEELQRDASEQPRRLFFSKAFPHLKRPAGYSISEDGIWSDRSEENISYGKAIVVSKLIKDIATGQHYYTINWFENEGWISRTVDAATLATANKLTSLSDFGFPVTSENASALVNYLAKFLETNRDTIEREQITTCLGWNDGNFVFQDEVIGENDSLHFYNNGGTNIVQGLKSNGTLDAWLDSISRTWPSHVARLFLYASFATVLLPIINISNFMIEVAGRTSTGKTTLLRLASSVWGDPDERQGKSLILSWNNTAFGLEKIAAVMNCLPLFLDDTKRLPDVEFAREFVYLLTNGLGKARGHKDGKVDTPATWRNITFSTGESLIIDSCRDGGVRGRVLEVSLPPFARECFTLSVSELNNTLCENYGHAGRIFVRYIFDHLDQKATWTEKFQAYKAELLGRSPDNLADRIANYGALICLAGELAHEAIAFLDPFQNPVIELWPHIASHTRDPIREEEAFGAVLSWVGANPQFIRERDASTDFEREVLGKIDKDGYSIISSQLRTFLEKNGYNAREIIHAWFERGFIKPANKDAKSFREQSEHKIRIVTGQSPIWVFKIPISKIESMDEPYVVGDDQSEDSDA